MCKKFMFLFCGICCVFAFAQPGWANQRIKKMDQAMARIAEQSADHETLDEVVRFVSQKDPKPVVRSEEDLSKLERPLTAQEKGKLQNYQKKTQKLNRGAFLKKTQEILKNVDARFNISGGLRYDQVRWTIAGPGGYPDILSDLDWRDQRTQQVTFQGDVCFYDKYVIDALYSTGNIVEGDVQDSDYLYSSRQGEFSRSYWDSEGGDVYDLMFGIGYRMNIDNERMLKMANCDDLSITFLSGYSKHEQDLVGEKGKQVIPLMASPLLENNLHQKYVTEWEGPWFGFELEGRRRKLTGTFRYQYHVVDYYAWADWNLRSEYQHPKSFEHVAKGRGFKINVGANYHLKDNFSIDFGMDFSKFHTAPGVDRIFLQSGGTLESALNEVLWNSHAFMLGGTYYFQ